MDGKCEYAEFDRYLSEAVCRKYGLPCRVACKSCTEQTYI